MLHIIKHDNEKFKSQNRQYYRNPAKEIKLALEMFKNDRNCKYTGMSLYKPWYYPALLRYQMAFYPC